MCFIAQQHGIHTERGVASAESKVFGVFIDVTSCLHSWPIKLGLRLKITLLLLYNLKEKMKQKIL